MESSVYDPANAVHRVMRRIQAGLLIWLCLCLAACSAAPQGAAEQPTATPHQPEKFVAAEELPFAVTLYFLSKDRSRLIACTRTVEAPAEQSYAEVAVRELMKGPQPGDGDGLIGVLPEKIKLNAITQSEGVVGVHFDDQFRTLSEEERFIARVALTNTLTGLADISAVHVMAGGRETGIMGYPAGVMTQVRDSWKTAWNLYYQQALTETSAEGYVDQKTVALYFIDPLGRKLLAETRSINVTGNAYAATILAELMKGPTDSEGMRPSVPASAMLAEEPRSDLDSSGRLVLTLNFTRDFANILLEQSISPDLTIGALTLTMIGFMPNIARVRFQVEGRPLNMVRGLNFAKGTFAWADYQQAIGRNITLYFPDEQNLSLYQVSRAVDYTRAHLASTAVEELLRGPLSGEEANAQHVFPSGIAPEDIQTQVISEKEAAIAFSKRLADILGTMSHEQERMFAYALVNTVTDIGRFRQVIFTLQQGYAETLAGNICMWEPLMHNPGLVRAGR